MEVLFPTHDTGVFMSYLAFPFRYLPRERKQPVSFALGAIDTGSGIIFLYLVLLLDAEAPLRSCSRDGAGHIT